MEAWLDESRIEGERNSESSNEGVYDPVYAKYLELQERGVRIRVYEPDDTVKDV